MPYQHAVQVSCRFRQCIGEDVLALEFPSDNTVMLQNGSIYTFDHVFSMNATQDMVFNKIGAPVIQELLNGYNCTILAYGQTGSGKTHTILGSKVEKGILPRIIQHTFEAITFIDADIQVTTGLFEVYQEKIQDLLNPSNTNLRIREDKEHGIWVEGAADIQVKDENAAMKLVQQGLGNRSIGAHLMNAESSRSHCIFLMTITQKFSTGVKQTGKLYIVDLAGSEMVRKTAASGKRLDEAKYINKSLTALGLVINALTDGKSKHVPYRDSKLTRLLQNSLGGNAKTHLILTCSSSSANLEETLSTIRFGTRAQHVQNSPHINSEKTISEYKQLLQIMELKVESLSNYVATLENKQHLCRACSLETKTPQSPPPVLTRVSSEKDLKPICQVCHGSEDIILLCDGNCGLYWHPQCVGCNNTNALEFYCNNCQPSIQDQIDFNLHEELSTLRQALQSMKQDRDQLEQSAFVDQQVHQVADQRNADIHRELEQRLIDRELQNESLSSQLKSATNQCELLKHELTELRQEQLRNKQLQQHIISGNSAEIEILRRSMEAMELENISLKNQLLEQTKRANLYEKRSREYQDQLESSRLLLAQRDEETTRLQRGYHSNSPSKPALSPGKIRPSTAADILSDARSSLQSRGNIQHWWSGDNPATIHEVPKPTNNINDDVSNSDGPIRPFKARLVGLLTSLQEEADAFKDLGDKMAEQTKPKIRKIRRNRLPAMNELDINITPQ
ncbi:kinesin [Thraustotheca clavata]|uniref:Kinesin-like protein n=1 Tax=Thraustotheca clavata TaxID=74557 RepID=A0A1V9ZHL8_9STRA|nr:kinesin [Thraustotheca clavata]